MILSEVVLQAWSRSQEDSIKGFVSVFLWYPLPAVMAVEPHSFIYKSRLVRGEWLQDVHAVVTWHVVVTWPTYTGHMTCMCWSHDMHVLVTWHTCAVNVFNMIVLDVCLMYHSCMSQDYGVLSDGLQRGEGGGGHWAEAKLHRWRGQHSSHTTITDTCLLELYDTPSLPPSLPPSLHSGIHFDEQCGIYLLWRAFMVLTYSIHSACGTG